jgi:sugar lactone lactonase YvrE
MAQAECIWPLRAVLGEGPVWVAGERALYFVDIKAPALHRISLVTGAKDTWPMPEPLGWIIPRQAKPGFIAGFQSHYAAITVDPLTIETLCPAEPDRPRNRRNDAKADLHGRIWAGSMDDAETQDSGALYRLDASLNPQRMDEGYRVANGPAFSPDGTVIYHTDSARRTVYRFDLSPKGELSGKRVFVQFEEAWGYPDGMCADSEGGIWIAHWDGGRVSRFDPDGRLERAIALPVSRPTSCAFGGDRLERMFVTSASIGVDEPLAGAVFAVDPGVRGAGCWAFAG